MDKHAQSLIDIIIDKVDPPRLGAELGVWKGELTSFLLRRFPELTLYAVDPWDTGPNVMGRYFVEDTGYTKRTEDKAMGRLRDARLEFQRQTAFASKRCIVIQEESSVGARRVADRSLDFVFIDGSHLYDYVKQDIEMWLPKVKIGGLVSGHDYASKCDRTGWFGVKRAVDEFTTRGDYNLLLAPWFIWYFVRTR